MTKHGPSVIIEAKRWDWDTMPDVLAWVGEHGHQDPNIAGQLVIHTADGDVWVERGEWVTKYADGRFGRCRAATFEPVEG